MTYKEALILLGLENPTNKAEVLKAYLNKAKIYHPDKATGSHDKFTELGEAKQVVIENLNRPISDSYQEDFDPFEVIKEYYDVLSQEREKLLIKMWWNHFKFKFFCLGYTGIVFASLNVANHWLSQLILLVLFWSMLELSVMNVFINYVCKNFRCFHRDEFYKPFLLKNTFFPFKLYTKKLIVSICLFQVLEPYRKKVKNEV